MKMRPLLAASLLILFAWATIFFGTLLLTGIYFQLLYGALGEPASTVMRFLTYAVFGGVWLVAWFKLAKLYLIRRLRRHFPTKSS